MRTNHMVAPQDHAFFLVQYCLIFLSKKVAKFFNRMMALPTNYSLVSSVALSVLTFAAMQVFSNELAVEGKMTILGGFIGSWFFVFCLTAVGNACTLMFGSTHNVRLFPEVALSLFISVFASALVHRVCATTCLIFSLVALYFINRISQSTYTQTTPTTSKPHPQTKSGPKSPGGKNKSKQG